MSELEPRSHRSEGERYRHVADSSILSRCKVRVAVPPRRRVRPRRFVWRFAARPRPEGAAAAKLRGCPCTIDSYSKETEMDEVNRVEASVVHNKTRLVILYKLQPVLRTYSEQQCLCSQ